ncbi:hypothetical protein [Promicromonospora iranensis]|uniref:Secreted protein n=1 Tax=Promicromonospora iranensis TaxID=1105144 RepID=A0ABU2CIU0_9MICO|nr:hypothetical protein [Promicromonospora iranensis]MDR7381239.1 hypothetical protein [Promicromonospora iranensis]
MRNSLKTWVLAHRFLSVLIVMLALVLVAVGLRLLTPSAAEDHRAAASPAAPSGASREVDGPAHSAPDPTAVPSAPIRQTTDPDRFVRAVAEGLFAWDTTSTNLPGLTEQLLTVADPTGEEIPGLLIDLRTYLPSPKVWTHLGQYRTRQWLEVTDVVEPAAWREALAQAPDGAVAEGTTARTVTGVRHRAGTWDGEPAAVSSPVQFTVFVVCGPAYDQCHLLRLSASDAALH